MSDMTGTIPLEKTDFNNSINSFISDLLYRKDSEKDTEQPHEYIKKTISVDPVMKHITNLVYSITIPQKWEKEGIAAPTVTSKENAQRIAKSLYEDYEIIPARVSATIEEGVFINYVNPDSDRILSIEIYNDSDIASILTSGKNIITSVDIVNDNFEEMIKLFKNV